MIIPSFTLPFFKESLDAFLIKNLYAFWYALIIFFFY